MSEVRVRFAPSPTGYLHVGGARTALYNWLFARRERGRFILRIEDTDADRSKLELTTAILDSMKWLGLTWDEGPFRQSERLARYREVAQELERGGHVYPCFCRPEELQAKRQQAEKERRAWKYDGTCRRLADSDRHRLRAEGRAPALRFAVPQTGETPFDDIVFGASSLANADIEDFVLLRSDGNPTYHLGVVVDDLDMRVTHVIRGADHLSNTPKQVLVYRALGKPAPRFAHLPLILGPDRQRLSKRHGATSVGAYREAGILPEALLNFLALLGWTPPLGPQPAGGGPPGGREIFSLDEMAAAFRLEDVSKSNAVFDTEKLAWMNGEYLRALPMERLAALAEEELKRAGLWNERFAADCRGDFRQNIALVQSRLRNPGDFSDSFRAFFSDEFAYSDEARKKFWKDGAMRELLETLAGRLAGREPFGAEEAEKALRDVADEKGVKAGVLINGARVALTGQAVAPPLFDVMAALGRERVLARLRRAAEFLRKSGG